MASSHCFFLLCLALLTAMAAAAQFRVGGPTGWAVPTDQWAEKTRFRIGDSILFVYPPDRDSVLQVNQDAYNSCNTSDYVQRFDDGNTVFTFNQSGPYYFISGDEKNCLRNESMVVMVMADRSSGSSVRPEMPPTAPLLSSPPPPPPSPAEVPPPPAEEATPPPSPSEVPPPPAEVTPSPPPAGGKSGTPPPSPNAAALKVVGFMGSVGTLLWPLFMF